MEVSLNNNINQLYMNGVSRLFYAQLDARLIAFYTILTVALSIMLSFKQSRCLIINATTTYPLFKVKKCLKCLKDFKVVKRKQQQQQQQQTKRTNSKSKCLNSENSCNDELNSTSNNQTSYYSYLSYTKYLKLKRLRSIASIATKFTSNTLRVNSYYLIKQLNSGLVSVIMRKSGLRGVSGASLSSTSSSASSSPQITTTKRHFFRFYLNKSSNGGGVGGGGGSAVVSNVTATKINPELCPTCDTQTTKRATFRAKPNKLSSNFNSMPTFIQTDLTSSDNDLSSDDDDNNNLRHERIRSKTFSNLNTTSASDSNLTRPKSLPKVHNSKIRLYKKLPLRSMSRAWGEINSIDLPVWCRKPCFYLYSWMFNCNLNEIDIEDLNEYKNLSEFFRRGLKPNVRVVDQTSCLISPCDGKILHFGKVDKGYLEQVKGVNYSLQAFLGEQNWPKKLDAIIDPNNNNTSSQRSNRPRFDLDSETVVRDDLEDHVEYEKSILYNPENCLYHCVIYLAPGDYHRFHSPTDWTMFYRRHFPGELFSVNPSVAKWLQGLFNLNERVVYYGQWKYGFFSMTPVGATNVGSIKVYMDESLTTNNKSSQTFEKNLDKSFYSGDSRTTSTSNETLNGVPLKRGDNFGEFNLGSTIVLIFEAPKNFEFNITQNEKVLYGRQLGSAVTSTYL